MRILQILIEIGRNCIHLKSLNISYCDNITDTAMSEISRNCIHLQSLNIGESSKITDNSRKLFKRKGITI